MKYKLLLVSLMCYGAAIAQNTLKLTLNRPEPRVDEGVTLSFDFGFFTKELSKQFRDGVKFTGSSSSLFGKSQDRFSREISFSKEGEQTLGPFQFELNGQTYVTDALLVNVAPALPYEEGVWIRLVQDQEGKQYIIIEQLVENIADKSRTISGYSYTVTGKPKDDDKSVSLKEISEDGISIAMKSSTTTTKHADNEDKFAPGMTFTYKMYEVSFEKGASSSFTLKKKHFNYLPKDIDFTKLVINNQ